jgi:chromosome segregation ATPase
MSEVVVDKLTQKVSNMLDEVSEVNLLIRRLPPAQETFNRIHERIDAIHVALKVFERGVQIDEEKLKHLEVQTLELKEGLREMGEQLEKQVQLFESTSVNVRRTIGLLEKEMSELVRKASIADGGYAQLVSRIDKFEAKDERWWQDNQILLGRFSQKMEETNQILIGIRVAETRLWIAVGIAVMLLLFLVFR